MRLVGVLVDEQRDGYAPRALARDAPVGTAIDHAGDTLFAPARDPAHRLDRGERGMTQAGLLHADEPLRRGAEDHRRLVPPAMRIAVSELRKREEHAAIAQQIDDGVVGLPD